jgi:ketosteroid isomerase-like protein
MLPGQLKRNPDELAKIEQLVEAGEDRPVLMLNMNSYRPEAAYPDGDLYRAYVSGLEALVESLGGAILWRLPALGQPVGEPVPTDEVLAIWYPSHRAYLDLPAAPGGEENYRLRSLCVERAVIQRCPGDHMPFESPRRAQEARRLVRAFFAAVTAGELPDSLLTPDMTGWTTTQGRMDKAAYQQVVRLLGQLTSTPLTFEIDAITTEDDRALAEVRSQGRLVDGSEYGNTYVFAFRIRDGRIASVAEHYNALIVEEKMMPLIGTLQQKA